MNELTIQRRFAVPVAKLYRAWCDPAQMRQWHAPAPKTVAEVQVDFRVGGSFRIVMLNPDGGRFTALGEYLEIAENALLRMTWQWEESTVRTELELRFTAYGGESELQLTHRQFPDAAMRDRHTEGWTGCVDSLAKFLAREGVAA